MYVKEETSTFKADLKANMQAWAEDKIDKLGETRPKLKAASVYMKRGLSNWLDREDMRIDHMVDNLLLFVTDEKGNIDTDVIIDDLIKMFKDMDVNKAKVGFLDVEYGKGEVKINIPHNPMLDLIFGDLGQVKITSEDILEIKEMFKG